MVMTCSSSPRPQHLVFLFSFVPFLSLAEPVTIKIDSSIRNLPSNATCLSQQSNFSGSLFSNNLNRLVSSIPSRQPNTYNFYSFLVGDQERVEAIGLCNRVLTRVDCLNCISQAAVNLTTTYCPQHREAYVRATKCMFRYSDKPIVGKLERVPVLEAPSHNNATGDRDEFIRFQNELLNRLRQEAAAGGAKRKYAQGNGTGPQLNTTFFASVQCTPDLYEKDCNNCLNYDLRLYRLESEYESDLPRKPRREQSKRRRVLALVTLVFIKLCYKKQSTLYIISLSTFVLKKKFGNLKNKI
ncbi:unnamed protein product [Eruca vesicaria subsp. sativa]|uniref:Gnk2-homologous domain-containing protein n=1 Tax=Eruca vesicaria subsp. sativa TaxID=29727 RepID=A0ABC8JUY8_ERUVS|nr:unnamed protein product [Eruca vesicaria subsp. sativa]